MKINIDTRRREVYTLNGLINIKQFGFVLTGEQLTDMLQNANLLAI